jgi:hypothetical protein
VGCSGHVVKASTVVDWINLLITEQAYISIRYMHFVQIYRSDLILGDNRLFTADCGGYLKSRSRLGLMFEHICVRSKLTETTSTPFWSGIGQVARLANPDARSCARSWAVDRGTGARQQSREPPGSSCCLSLLTGGFRPTTRGCTLYPQFVSPNLPEVASLLNTSEVSGKGFTTRLLKRFPNLWQSAKVSSQIGHNSP